MPPSLLQRQLRTLEPRQPDEPAAVIDMSDGVEETVSKIVAAMPGRA